MLQFDPDLKRVGPVDIAERVVAGRAAFPVRRVEQHNLLAALAAETRRDFVVLTLNIEHDNRIRPLQQIGNDDADALARSGRGFEQYMLHLAHHEKAVAEKAIADAAEHNALLDRKSRLADFTFARETRLAVKDRKSTHLNSSH